MLYYKLNMFQRIICCFKPKNEMPPVIYKNMDEEKYDYNIQIKVEKNFFLDKSYHYSMWPWSYTFVENKIIKNF